MNLVLVLALLGTVRRCASLLRRVVPKDAAEAASGEDRPLGRGTVLEGQRRGFRAVLPYEH